MLYYSKYCFSISVVILVLLVPRPLHIKLGEFLLTVLKRGKKNKSPAYDSGGENQ